MVIDHIIPKGLCLNIPIVYKILDEVTNKQLIHESCHKTKTKEDKILIKKFKEDNKEIKAVEKDIKAKMLPNDYFKKVITNKNFNNVLKKYKIYTSLIKNI